MHRTSVHKKASAVNRIAYLARSKISQFCIGRLEDKSESRFDITVTVATTRLAPLTLTLKLYFSPFTVISCHFFVLTFQFWMFSINFIFETVPIDVI